MDVEVPKKSEAGIRTATRLIAMGLKAACLRSAIDRESKIVPTKGLAEDATVSCKARLSTSLVVDSTAQAVPSQEING